MRVIGMTRAATRPLTLVTGGLPEDVLATGRVGPSGLGRRAPEPMSAAVRLRPTYGSVRVTRQFVQQTLAAWRADDIRDDVSLVASELVANALRYGVRLDPPGTGPRGSSEVGESTVRLRRPRDWGLAGAGPVAVNLFLSGSRLVCAVTDPSIEPPSPVVAPATSRSGRGLQIVQSLSQQWGWSTLTDGERHVGKAVWAVFALEGGRREAHAI